MDNTDILQSLKEKLGERQYWNAISGVVACLVIDATGAIQYATEKAEELFGYGHGELVGKRVEDLMPHRFRGQHPQHRLRFLREAHDRTMGERTSTLRGLRQDGSEFPVEIGLFRANVEHPDDRDNPSHVIANIIKGREDAGATT